jgi:hypothetical protein
MRIISQDNPVLRIAKTTALNKQGTDVEITADPGNFDRVMRRYVLSRDQQKR